MNASLPSRRAVVVSAVAALALTGCSSTSNKGADSSDDGSKRYAEALNKLSETTGYHVVVTSKGTPNDTSSLESGEGDVVNKPAAFQGKVKVNTGGNRIDAEIISIEKTSWAKMALLGPNYREFTPADVGVPSPVDLFSTAKGLPVLPTKAKDLKKTGEKLVGGEQVTMFKGTVSGTDAVSAMNFGRPRADYTVEVGLTGSNEMRVLTMTGPFFDAVDATYTLNFSKYGQKKTITKP